MPRKVNDANVWTDELGRLQSGPSSSVDIKVGDITADGEMMVTESEREKNVRAGYSLSGINANAWAVLADLSDTTNWPHDDTGRIDISQISMQVDKSSNSVGILQVGVVLRVSATDGDFLPIAGIRFENGTAAANLVRDISYSPSQVKCGVVSGNCPNILANGSKVLANTGLQNDVAIPSARGQNVIPAVGDIVARFVHTGGGVWTGGVGIMYHSHPSAA